MTRRVCPKCKERLLAPFIACSACPWTEGTGTRTEAQGNRCSFEQDNRRCHYVASIFEGQLRGTGSGVCRGHFRYTEASAFATLEESERRVPMDFDYSARSLHELTLKAYTHGPSRYGSMTDLQRALVWRFFPRIAERAKLPRPSFDAEAEAERAAIQNEGHILSGVRL